MPGPSDAADAALRTARALLRISTRNRNDRYDDEEEEDDDVDELMTVTMNPF